MTKNTDSGAISTQPISRRAAIAQMIIISVIVFGFSIAIIFFNTYRLYDQLEDRIASISRLAETSLASAVWQVDHASARDFIDAVLHDESVIFAQVSTGREIMASGARSQYTGQPFDFFENNRGFITDTVEIKKFGDWIGTFTLVISTESIHREILINGGATLALAVILILAIGKTSLYFARKNLFDPLKHLEESATAIANGELDTIIDVLPPNELGNLARAFDDMRESLLHLIDDLKTANIKLQHHRDLLETTVKERTEELKRKNTSLNQALEDVRKSKKTADIANLTKSRFLASMSHEIRTPMNAILGMADILWETELTEEQTRYVQIFRTAGENLLDILNDILDLSKIEAGRMDMETTDFNLNETIEKTCMVIESKANEKHLEFTYTVAQDVPTQLFGDPKRLSQILLNLLGNAVKFTDTGSVNLTVDNTPDRDNHTMLHFSVKDTGPGIPANKLQTIFDSFTQADSSTTREYGGTGLGLAISKQLCQMMGGRIWAESSPGKGSTFHFTSRFDLSTNPAVPTQENATFDQPPLPKANILMLEDSKYNAFVIQTYLKDTPCYLTVVEDGEHGVEKFKNGNWDIVLMDIQMPAMDGYEATKTIRLWEQEHGLDSTPIIAMTAHALVGDAEKSLAAGADHHLPKPVKKSALFKVLSEMLKTNNSRRPS